MIKTAQQKANESAIVELENIICAIVSGRYIVVKTEITEQYVRMEHVPIREPFRPPETEHMYKITLTNSSR